MKCTNKEQEQEFISEILRVLKKEYENPTYCDLDVDIRNNITHFSLLIYKDLNARQYILHFTVIKNDLTSELSLNNFGPISIELDESQTIEFHYMINLFKKQYLEKVLASLKSK